MALQRIIFPSLCRNFYRVLAQSRQSIKRTPSPKKSSTVEIDDAFDNFTTEFIQRRVDLWESRKKVDKNFKGVPSEKYNSECIRTLSNTRINELFNNALFECDDSGVIQLLEECLKCEKYPSHEVLIQILHICALRGEIKLIQSLKDLKNCNEALNFDFSIYEAHALWVKGNVMNALKLFEELYTTNPFLRRHVKVLIKRLLFDGIKDTSEAVLINLVKLSEKLVEKHKDYFIMLIVWEYCFLSEWFSDQEIALELLTKHKRLCEKLENKLPFVLSTTLKNHRTESVYRLLEVFLSLEMQEYYSVVAVALLDYQCLQGNLRSYREIISWCQSNDIKLPQIYNEKYLQLLLNHITTYKPKKPPKDKSISFKYQF